MAVKEELIKIRVALEGAKESKAELDALNRARAAGSKDQAKSAAGIKAVGAAARSASAPITTAATAQEKLATASSKTALAGKLATGGIQGMQGAAVPLTMSLASGAGAATGLAAASTTMGAALNAALGPIGLVVSAIGLIGSALLSARKAKKDDAKATREWSREYKQRSAEVILARDEVHRAHKASIDLSEDGAVISALEHELEMLELLGGSREKILETQEKLHAAREEELATTGRILRADREVAKIEAERASQALKALHTEQMRIAQQSKSKKQAEEMRAINDKILDAQDAVTAAIDRQNSVKQESLSLTQQQLELERKREREVAAGKLEGLDKVKKETTETLTGFDGEVPIEAMQFARETVIAAGGTEADADEVVMNIIDANAPKPKARGGGKAKKEEKVEARFGDYRAVLQAYADSRAGVDAKALDSLAKGSMPKDHRPETSIQVTNHNNYSFDSQINIDGKDKGARTLAVDMAAFFQSEVARAIKQTPNGLVR